ncbi:hypothetical protein [Peribacillus frigoritolerans]|uniref:hypothetical protein n=1 Tax=Peribacillus frigoritolerans TaxID=450367 RepID=UPI0023D9B419|nr:hypothetical protein [Peribacillus frigoritolerans]MDF1999483.1 hypothetical protein [Peribacillus frigoritolerans]
MKIETDVESLYQKMVKGHSLDINHKMIQLVDKEKSAIYFASLQKDFDVVKRVVQALSGSLLLMQLGVKQDVSLTVSTAKESLVETTKRIKDVVVPLGLKIHFDHLMYSVQALNRIFTKYSLAEDIYFMNERQLEEIQRALDLANSYLKKSSTFSMGLGMISLETSCFCGAH